MIQYRSIARLMTQKVQSFLRLGIDSALSFKRKVHETKNYRTVMQLMSTVKDLLGSSQRTCTAAAGQSLVACQSFDGNKFKLSCREGKVLPRISNSHFAQQVANCFVLIHSVHLQRCARRGRNDHLCHVAGKPQADMSDKCVA